MSFVWNCLSEMYSSGAAILVRSLIDFSSKREMFCC
jgi:hypothetical protein